MPQSGELGHVIDEVFGSRKANVDQFFALLYPELRRIAAAQMRAERPDHSWSPTMLVSELYLELLKNRALDSDNRDDDRRRAFLGLSGFCMKRLLIAHTRPLSRRVLRAAEGSLLDLPAEAFDPEGIVFVETLLANIEAIDARLRAVVELRVFQGKSTGEIAVEIGCSERTVGTLWAFARKWLAAHLAEREV